MEKTFFLDKAKIIFGNEYDYSKVPDIFNPHDTLEIICPKHGSFFKRGDNHLYKKQGCSKCMLENKQSTKIKNEDFIERLKKVYDITKYSFDKVDYTGIENDIIITCKEHGDFSIKARNALYKHPKCKKCVNHTLSKESFIVKAKELYGDYYDYSKVNFTKSKDKVEIICPKHGSFFLAPVIHINNHVGCAKCAHGTFSIEEFIEKAKEKYGNYYDYSKVNFSINSDKVEIICPKHGSFFQSPLKHLAGKKPCPECRKILTESEDFIKMAQDIHGLKYNYDEINFINMATPVKVVCPKHGPFYPIPSNHISKKTGCPKCATAYNLNENELKDFIKSLNFSIIENDRQTIKRDKKFLELDCFIPDKNIAIEFDGLFWHSSDKKDKNYHLNKTLACEDKGIKLIHIFEDEWIFKKKIVKSRLKAILGLTPYKIYARKCTVKEISVEQANKFIEKYHIQGTCNASVKLGLFYKNRLCAVMTFSKSRFNKNYDWELIRYCTLSNFNVIGGAGKLLSYFRKKYIGSIISYADRRWSDGNLYRRLNFKELVPSPPSYWYFLGKKRYSRTLFQKHLLSSKLKIFDENKTEKENMKKNGYLTIYDCGNFVFTKEK